MPVKTRKTNTGTTSGSNPKAARRTADLSKMTAKSASTRPAGKASPKGNRR